MLAIPAGSLVAFDETVVSALPRCLHLRLEVVSSPGFFEDESELRTALKLDPGQKLEVLLADLVNLLVALLQNHLSVRERLF